jgi:hypothetical protein
LQKEKLGTLFIDKTKATLGSSYELYSGFAAAVKCTIVTLRQLEMVATAFICASVANLLFSVERSAYGEYKPL